MSGYSHKKLVEHKANNAEADEADDEAEADESNKVNEAEAQVAAKG